MKHYIFYIKLLEINSQDIVFMFLGSELLNNTDTINDNFFWLYISVNTIQNFNQNVYLPEICK